VEFFLLPVDTVLQNLREVLILNLYWLALLLEAEAVL
jgi:hypothetical protein